MNQENIQNLLSDLEKELTNTSHDDTSGYGIITSSQDGVIKIEGLQGLRMGELVSIKDTDIQALVLGLEKDTANALILQPNTIVKEGMYVKSSGTDLSIDVSDDVIGNTREKWGKTLVDDFPICVYHHTSYEASVYTKENSFIIVRPYCFFCLQV